MSRITRRDFLKASTAAVATGVFGTTLLAASGCAAAASDAPSGRRVRAAVCSPTGGTMNAVWLLADKLSDNVEIIDQTAKGTRSEEIRFEKDELAIMAAPSYAGKIPYLPDLFTNLKGEKTPCILVASFGNRACENNFAQMKAIASENGFVVIGAIAVVTPHVLGAKAGHSRPDLEDQKVMQEFADQILEKLSAGSLEEITVEGNAEWGEKYESTVEKSYRAENCTQCGTCEQSCPAGAIDAATLEIDSQLCVHCQRCTHVCRFNARNYAANRDAVDEKYFAYQPVSYIV